MGLNSIFTQKAIIFYKLYLITVSVVINTDIIQF